MYITLAILLILLGVAVIVGGAISNVANSSKKAGKPTPMYRLIGALLITVGVLMIYTLTSGQVTLPLR